MVGAHVCFWGVAGAIAGEVGEAQIHLTPRGAYQGPAVTVDKTEKDPHVGRNHVGAGEGKGDEEGTRGQSTSADRLARATASHTGGDGIGSVGVEVSV